MTRALFTDYLTSDKEVNVGTRYIVTANLERIKRYWKKYEEKNQLGYLDDNTLAEFCNKCMLVTATVDTDVKNTGKFLSRNIVKCRDAEKRPQYLPVEILSRITFNPDGGGTQVYGPHLPDQTPIGENIPNSYRDAAAGGIDRDRERDADDASDGDDGEDLEGIGDLLEYFTDLNKINPGMLLQVTDDFDTLKNNWIQCELDTGEISGLKKYLNEECVCKGIEHIETEVSYEMELNLKNHLDARWGVTVNFDTWIVTEIHDVGQFKSFGVQEGFDVLAINGISVWEDVDTSQEMMMRGPECTLLLGIPARREKFLDDYLSRNMAVVLVEFIEFPGRELKIPWRSLVDADPEGKNNVVYDPENFDISKFRRKPLQRPLDAKYGASYKVTADPDVLQAAWEECNLDPFVDCANLCREKGLCCEIDYNDNTIKLEWISEGDIFWEWFPVTVCTHMRKPRPKAKRKRSPARTAQNEAIREAAEKASKRLQENAMIAQGAYYDVQTGEHYFLNARDLHIGKYVRISGNENRIRDAHMETWNQPISNHTLSKIMGQKCTISMLDTRKEDRVEVSVEFDDVSAVSEDIWVPVSILQPLVTTTSFSFDDENEQKAYPTGPQDHRDPAQEGVIDPVSAARKAHGIYKYSVKADEVDSWGIIWNWKTWRVKYVNKKKQMYKLGIREGWRLLGMNDMKLSVDYEDFIKECLEKGMECSLEFNVDKLKKGDEVMMFAVKKSEYEGLAGVLIEEMVEKHMWRMQVYELGQVKRIPVANIVKKDRAVKFSQKKSAPTNRQANKRRALDDMDMEQQPTYGGVKRFRGIHVDEHVRIIGDIDELMRALDTGMASDGLIHRDDAEEMALQVVRVLEIDPVNEEVTVKLENANWQRLPISCVEHIKKVRTTDDMQTQSGGSRIPSGNPHGGGYSAAGGTYAGAGRAWDAGDIL